MKTSPYRSISLFSGCGGMDIGIHQAGFDILVDIEKDPYCCETLRHSIENNQSNTHIIEDDIKNVQPESLLQKFNLETGDLDLLFGGPPCQAFSQIGKQKSLDDERGVQPHSNINKLIYNNLFYLILIFNQEIVLVYGMR